MDLLAVAPPSPRDAVMTDRRTIDLDASANTAPTPAVVAAVVDAMSVDCGNPSSNHRRGERARTLLVEARDAVSSLVLGAFGEGVTFTSGCTEANNLVLVSHAQAGARIVTTAVEHPSVLATARRIASAGGDVEIVPVGSDGLVRTDLLLAAVERAPGLVLLSVQAANSETGVLQDLVGIAQAIADRPATAFHADAAQAYGKGKLQLGRGLGPDIVTVSGHKLHAPMGVGAVVCAADADVELLPLLVGGDQEGGIRAGTEPLPLIAGMGVACKEWYAHAEARCAYLLGLRKILEQRLVEIGGVSVNGAGVPRLPNIVSATFAGCDAMSMVANLNSRGICVSQGSACSSRRPEPSHVLMAMGMDEAEAFSTIRFSLSALNDAGDVDRGVDVIAEVVGSLRRRS